MFTAWKKWVGDLWPNLISRVGNNSVLGRVTLLGHQRGRCLGILHPQNESPGAVLWLWSVPFLPWNEILDLASWDALGLCQQNVENGAQCVCAHLDFLPWEWPEQTALSNSLLLNRWGYWPASISIFQVGKNEIALLWLGWVQCINKNNNNKKKCMKTNGRVHENPKNLDNLLWFQPWLGNRDFSSIFLFIFCAQNCRVCSGIA